MNLQWLRKAAPYLGIVIGLVIIFDGYVFYSRWSSKKDEERRQAEQEAAFAKKTLNVLGSGALKINSFYVSPAAIHPGTPADICYSVTGAKTLKLDPPVEEVWPALNHCFQVKPAKTTEYKLIADDGAGHTTEESFALQVVR